jgi:hypothetical protein
VKQAAFIVVALIVVLSSPACGGSSGSPASTPTEPALVVTSGAGVIERTPVPTPSLSPQERFLAGLAGRWGGIVDQPDYGEYPMVLSFAPQSITVDYDTLDCGGVMRILSFDGRELSMQEEISYGEEICGEGGSVLLTRSGEMLRFNWYFPTGEFGASAVLTRQ